MQLADFGLSRVLDTGRTHVSTQTHGTLAYQPAELLQEGKLTKAADVHSFGMIMYEVYTHKRLFGGCNMGQVRLPHFHMPSLGAVRLEQARMAWMSWGIPADDATCACAASQLMIRCPPHTCLCHVTHEAPWGHDGVYINSVFRDSLHS